MRLIDADALEREYQEQYKLFTWDDGEREKATLARVIQVLHAQPTIDERKTEWIPKSESGCIIECSMCGERMTVLGDENPNFCPNCGADMRGENGNAD